MIGVTGANGLLGRTLCSLNQECIPITRKDFDLTDDISIRNFIQTHSNHCKTIINCAAMIGRKCEDNKKLCYQTNVIGLANLKKWCDCYNVRLIHISTDYVFGGEYGYYNENDIPYPFKNGDYAISKYLGELTLASSLQTSTILRVSFCDSKKWPYDGAYGDKYSNRCYVEEMAAIILALVKKDNLPKIVHLGTTKKSFYQLAKKIKPDVKSISIKDSKFYVPPDTSFDLTLMLLILKRMNPKLLEEMQSGNERWWDSQIWRDSRTSNKTITD